MSAKSCTTCGHSFESRGAKQVPGSWSQNNPGWTTLGAFLLAVVFLMWLAGCFVSSRDPVPTLAGELSRFPEYSIVVDDVDDGLFRNYLRLKSTFRVSEPVGEKPSEGKPAQFEQRVDTYTVIDRFVGRYEKYVGMVVASKTPDGKLSGYAQAYPPFYQHVGHPQYGHWSSGGFWVWYGQYAFMRSMLGGHRVRRDDHDAYVRSRNRGLSYYGPRTGGRPTFGADGAVTAKTRPSFYQKYQSKQASFRARAAGRSGFSRRFGK